MHRAFIVYSVYHFIGNVENTKQTDILPQTSSKEMLRENLYKGYVFKMQELTDVLTSLIMVIILQHI